ncbi:MAG: phenylacetate--CoA ligase family protein, partial [Deltaproteobacteria bacterium]
MLDRKGGYYDEALETMPREERERFEEELVKEAVDLAFRLSPAMRKKMEEAGVTPDAIRSKKDLEKIPVTRKGELRAVQERDLPFGGLVGVELSSLKRIYVSPGPIYDPQGRDEDHWRWERVFYATGFREGDIVQNTFSYHLTPAGLMFDEALT